MRHRSLNIIVTTAAAVSVLGVGVATAADPPTCPYGNTPQAGKVVKGQGSGAKQGQQLRKRDGTGARHGQKGQQLRKRDGTGPFHAQNSK